MLPMICVLANLPPADAEVVVDPVAVVVDLEVVALPACSRCAASLPWYCWAPEIPGRIEGDAPDTRVGGVYAEPEFEK